MRLLLPALVLLVLGTFGLNLSAQAPVVRTDAAVDASPATAPTTRPTEILQGPLTALQQALSGVRLEKWKMSGELRDAADADLRSIERDFRETLPPLLATADAEPGSVAKVLPVLRNVDAMYDVALRVAAMGRLTAPAQQSAALENALQQVSSARRQVGDQVQQAAVAEESRVGELQTSLKASQAAVTAAQASAAPVAQPATKPVVKPKRKPRPKPVTPAAGASAPATTPASGAKPQP